MASFFLFSSKTVFLRDSQPSGVGDTHFHFTWHVAPKQSIYAPVWLQNFGRNAAATAQPDESLWCWWTEAAHVVSGVWLGAKHNQWCNKWVAQMFSCTYSCQRRTFKHLIWLKSTYRLTVSFLILWMLNCCYYVKYVRFSTVFDILYFTR